MSEPARPSRTVRPWELSSASRPVWAWPECPAGHGRLFVGSNSSSTDAPYRCHAPWCEVDDFDEPEGWTRELTAEFGLEGSGGPA